MTCRKNVRNARRWFMRLKGCQQVNALFIEMICVYRIPPCIIPQNECSNISYLKINVCNNLLIGGVRYHKKCMKCATCNRKLDSRSFCIDKKEIYCTVCLKKNRLQTSPKIYSDTTIISPNEEKGCPR